MIPSQNNNAIPSSPPSCKWRHLTTWAPTVRSKGCVNPRRGARENSQSLLTLKLSRNPIPIPISLLSRNLYQLWTSVKVGVVAQWRKSHLYCSLPDGRPRCPSSRDRFRRLHWGTWGGKYFIQYSSFCVEIWLITYMYLIPPSTIPDVESVVTLPMFATNFFSSSCVIWKNMIKKVLRRD